MPDVPFLIVLRGYDIAEVDALISRADAALGSADPATRAAVARELLGPGLRIRLRGYDRLQVDKRLAALADQLSTR